MKNKPDPKTRPGQLISCWPSLVLISALSLPACSSSLDCASSELICAGLVTDAGGIDDHGLNQDAWEGLQDAISENAIQRAEYIDSSDNRDYSKNIEFFTDREFDIILTVGPGQQQETMQAAENNPAVQFVGFNQIYSEDRSNLHTILFHEAQIGYLAGAVAAMTTQTGVVAAICESSGFDSIRQNCEGFRLGASSCGEICGLRKDQMIDVLVRYREYGDPDLIFNDPEWGEKVTKETIRKGADVLFAVGGGTGQGAIRAAADAGVFVIGAEKDQWFELPEAQRSLITSVYGDSRRAVREWMHLFTTGGKPATLEVPFMRAPYHGIELSQSLDIEEAINRVMLDLENGTLAIPNLH